MFSLTNENTKTNIPFVKENCFLQTLLSFPVRFPAPQEPLRDRQVQSKFSVFESSCSHPPWHPISSQITDSFTGHLPHSFLFHHTHRKRTGNGPPTRGGRIATTNNMAASIYVVVSATQLFCMHLVYVHHILYICFIPCLFILGRPNSDGRVGLNQDPAVNMLRCP